MTNDHDSDTLDADLGDRFDAFAFSAGRDLRRPAPDSVLARVHRRQQNRQRIRLAGVSAAVLAVIGVVTFNLAGRQHDRDRIVPITLPTGPSGSVDESPPGTTAESVEVVPPTNPQASAPTSDVEATVAETTTVEPTTPTSPATTTTVASPAPWSPEAAYPSGFVLGCCAGNATGPASPPLTADPDPLADGTYAMEIIDWNPASPTQLRLSIRSLVPCADGVRECAQQEDGTYGVDAVGYSEQSRIVDVTLDNSVAVYLGGSDLDAPIGTGFKTMVRSTNGTSLAALMTAIAEAYETNIAGPLAAGATPESIEANLQANPELGFTNVIPEGQTEVDQLYFQFQDAPPVLLPPVRFIAAQDDQVGNVVLVDRSGTSALIPMTITIRDNLVTLELFAGHRA